MDTKDGHDGWARKMDRTQRSSTFQRLSTPNLTRRRYWIGISYHIMVGLIGWSLVRSSQPIGYGTAAQLESSHLFPLTVNT